VTDGELAWHFLAAPRGRRTVSHEQLESVWPIHGSVLVLNDVVYCAAGRSTWIDEGIDLYGLNPLSGKVLHKNHYARWNHRVLQVNRIVDAVGRNKPARRLVSLILLALLLTGCQGLINQIGGNFKGPPEQLNSAISPEAKRLIAKSFEGIDASRLADAHVHMIGPQVNPTWLSPWHPIRFLRTQVFLSAAGVEGKANVEEQYLGRLEKLIKPFPKDVTFFLYAMDRRYNADGKPDMLNTPYYVANRTVMNIAEKSKGRFVPVVSIHPYRDDAISSLKHWASRGVRYLKWLPNSMGIDPDDARLTDFYRELKKLNVTLLTHTGHEHTFEAINPDLGNPLLLRRALDLQVRVVALHMASDETSIDLDDPDRRRRPAFDLLLRLMNNPKYDQLLFADMASMSFYNHRARPLRTLMERRDLQNRTVYGSDYPLPGINMATQTSALVRDGFLNAKEAAALEEIYAYNPLLFDYVLKRTVRHPDSGKPLDPEAFMIPPALHRPKH
jgi:mannonate dehydratase